MSFVISPKPGWYVAWEYTALVAVENARNEKYSIKGCLAVWKKTTGEMSPFKTTLESDMNYAATFISEAEVSDVISTVGDLLAKPDTKFEFTAVPAGSGAACPATLWSEMLVKVTRAELNDSVIFVDKV